MNSQCSTPSEVHEKLRNFVSWFATLGSLSLCHAFFGGLKSMCMCKQGWQNWRLNKQGWRRAWMPSRPRMQLPCSRPPPLSRRTPDSSKVPYLSHL